MVEVRHRTEDPSSAVAFMAIHIPDDANCGTGTFRVVLKKKGLIRPVEGGPQAVVAAFDDAPRIQVRLKANSATRELSVLLWRADGGPAVSNRTFLMPATVDAEAPHEFTAAFRDWRVLSLQMDGQELERDLESQFVRASDTQTGTAVERLGAFVYTYNEALGDIIASGSNDAFGLHTESVVRVQLIEASDGFLVTYHPYHDSFRDGAGVFFHNLSNYNLDTVSQWLTAHMLRVGYPEIGSAYKPSSPVPDVRMEEEVLPGNFGIMLHPEIRADLKSTGIEGSPTPVFPCVQASPFVHYEQGIAREIVPCRFKLWSPVVELPGVGLRRLYHFTHADLWWYPERLNLDFSEAAKVAHLDLQAFDAVIGSVTVFGPDQAQRDTPQHASELYEAFCDELEALLESAGNDEEQLHQWLNRRPHHIFLDSDSQTVWSKLRFGKNFSDFVVRCSDGRYKLIEIERGDLRIIQKKGQKPTADFNHACSQVRDWKRHVGEHVHEVRDVQGLAGIYNPTGVVIMGRTRDIDSAEAQRRWNSLKNDFDIEVFTYDDMCDRVRQLAGMLRRLMIEL